MAANDFIQNFMNMLQLRGQFDQLDMQRKQGQVNQLTQFLTLARQTTDPELQTGLVDTFAQMGAGSHDTLSQLLRYTTPQTDILPTHATRQGMIAMQGHPTGDTETAAAVNRLAALRNLTGMTGTQFSGDVASERMFNTAMQNLSPDIAEVMRQTLVHRAIAGMTPGEAARDQAMAGLPGDVHSQGAQIALGTTPSAAQTRQMDQVDLQREQDWNFKVWSLSLQEAGLHLDMAKLNAQGEKSANARAIIDELGKDLRDFAKSKRGMSDQEAQVHLNKINIGLQQLKDAGILPQEQPLLTVDDVWRPNWFTSLFGIGK